MNWFAIGLTYAVCWWLVLFMVLPWGAHREVSPQLGNAVSAPARPRLRLKLLITSVLTIVPTIAFYFAMGEARANPHVYSTSGAGKGCTPATLPNDAGDIPIDVNVPIAPYLNSFNQGSPTNTNMLASQGGIGLGEGMVKTDGTVELNGMRLGAVDNTGNCSLEPDDDEEEEWGDEPDTNLKKPRKNNEK